MQNLVLDLKGHKEIYLGGDSHFPRCCRPKFLEMITEIMNNKDALFVGLGDWVEGIIPSDPRFNPEEMASVVQASDKAMNMLNEQWYQFESDIELIKDKIVGLHAGNHGGNIIRRYSNNELSNICRRLKCKYLGDGVAIFEINCGDNVIKMQTMHGIGGGISAGHTYNKLDHFSRIFADMDIVATGHTHKLGVNISIAPLEFEDGRLKQKIQYHCSCGSFLPNYEMGVTGYGERRAYRPLPMGFVKVIINKGKISHVIPVPL